MVLPLNNEKKLCDVPMSNVQSKCSYEEVDSLCYLLLGNAKIAGNVLMEASKKRNEEEQ